MTTDSGIDLVAWIHQRAIVITLHYSGKNQRASFQRRRGWKTFLGVGFTVSYSSLAGKIIAVTDLSTEKNQ